MNKIKISLLVLIGILSVGSVANAAPNYGQPINKDHHKKRLSEGCSPATAAVDLDINNVRAHILNGGDMWWDLVGLAKYEVPKVTQEGQPRRTSLFAGSLWIGGYDGGNLKEAAMTYRQSGSDFFPGPLDTANGGTGSNECLQYDKIWKVNKTDIDNFRNGTAPATADMINWPAAPLTNSDNVHASKHTIPSLQIFAFAPFKDMDGDGQYSLNQFDAKNSDYPLFIAHTPGHDCEFLPDQNLWWVYNDNGNTHNETHALAIGLEVQVHAFAFITNDQLNSATFYAYTIINRGTYTLDSTFFGQWVDPDLGYAFDDYVAVDTNRSLGMDYNGENNDPGALGYGKNLPAVGVDFFLGPKADKSTWFTIDRNHDGKIDVLDNYLPMTNFVYYNNDFTRIGNPEQQDDYYYYLTSRWKDGAYIHNDGKNGTGGGPRTHFMFPGDPRNSDPSQWTEKNAGNPPGDRRFLQSAGPFKLEPGAVNYVTVGAVWAQSSRQSDNTDAITELLFADDLAQTLYDDCFQLRIGPEPPSVQVTELANKVVLSFTEANNAIANTEKKVLHFGKDTFNFEGYLVYQLASSSVSAGELGDISKARLVSNSDVKSNTIPTTIINYEFDPVLKTTTAKPKVDRENLGARHTYEITKDLFATGDDKLVNDKFYYYMVMAYAYNPHPNDKNTFFLGGRPATVNGVPQIVAVPHSSSPLFGGASLNADFGTQIPVRKIEGVGNGGNSIDLDPASISELFGNSKSTIDQPLYVKGAGPVSIKVYDPLLVQGGDYNLKIYDSVETVKTDSAFVTRNFYESNPASTRWIITKYNDGSKKDDTLAYSQDSISIFHDQVVSKLGLIVSIAQPLSGKFPLVTDTSSKIKYKIDPFKFSTEAPGAIYDSSVRETNGFIEATINFDDPSNYWLTGIHDGEQPGTANPINPFNWIRSGTHKDVTTAAATDPKYDDVEVAPDYTNLKKSFPSVYQEPHTQVLTEKKTETKNEYTVIAKTAVYVMHSQSAYTIFYKGNASGRSFDIDTTSLPAITIPIVRLFGSTRDTVYAKKTNVELSVLNAGDTLYIDTTFEITGTKKILTHTSYDNWADPRQVYEGVLNATVAPGGLVARSEYFKDKSGIYEFTLGPIPDVVDYANQRINMTNSVDLVFTADKSKWTKCIVIEEGETGTTKEIPNLNEGGANKFDIRKHDNPFVDGAKGPVYNPGANTGEKGYSWFPGYAINVETGERLNIMFGEDSHFPTENGNDMLWNPTNNFWQFGYVNPTGNPLDYQNEYLWGGKHWIYVMSSRNVLSNVGMTKAFRDKYPQFAKERGVAYDSCHTYFNMLNDPAFTHNTILQHVFGDVMWVVNPVLSGTGKLNSVQDGLIPTETKMRLRVVTPYASYANASGTPKNHDQPMYSFNTNSIAPTVSTELGKKALPEVNVVPNPYYAYSKYETSQLDNRVRITNLPAKCTINIYTVDGALVRKFNVAQPVGELRTTFLDWDLKNSANVPIASGVYLIHINAGELGEKVIKWFGVMRPIDLDTF